VESAFFAIGHTDGKLLSGKKFMRDIANRQDPAGKSVVGGNLMILSAFSGAVAPAFLFLNDRRKREAPGAIQTPCSTWNRANQVFDAGTGLFHVERMAP
jgi:hypothetical protein